MMGIKYDEQKVLELLQEDDTRREGFSMAVEHYSSQLYWQIRRLVLSHDDAQDILQETFLSAWNNICYFRAEARLSTWLYRIAMNLCLNFLKKDQNRMASLEEEAVQKKLEDLSSDVLYDGDGIDRALQKALLELPPKQRMVFNMRYYENLSYDDISNIMGTTVGALKADYHHAVKKIKKSVEDSML